MPPTWEMPPISLTDEELFAIFLCTMDSDTLSSDEDEDQDEADDDDGRLRHTRTRKFESSAGCNDKYNWQPSDWSEDSSGLRAR